jgi:hypothetical protein
VHRLAQRRGGFLGGHPAEVPHLNQLHQRLVFAGQRFEGAIQIQQIHPSGARIPLDFKAGLERVDVCSRLARAFLGGPRACIVHQDLSHHPRCYREEMHSIGESTSVVAHELQVGLVHQRRSLQRVARPFPFQVPGSDAVQFVVQRGDQRVEG